MDHVIIERCLRQAPTQHGPSLEELVSCIEQFSGVTIYKFIGASLEQLVTLRGIVETALEELQKLFDPKAVTLDFLLCAQELDLSQLCDRVAAAFVDDPNYVFDLQGELNVARWRLLTRWLNQTRAVDAPSVQQVGPK